MIIKNQVRIINACFVLHNFLIDEKMDEDDILHEVDCELEHVEVPDNEDLKNDDYYISTAWATDEWNIFRDNLDMKMFNEYQTRRTSAT